MMQEVSSLLIRPGGNDTVIVTTPVAREKQKEISNFMLQKYITAEQVVFIEDNGKRGQMAGGEFCCNAARALGFYFLSAKDGDVEFVMSGIETPVKVSVSNGNSKVYIPLEILMKDTVTPLTNDTYLVNLKGIIHLVILQQSPLFRKNAGKDYADKILNDLGLKSNQAAGILFFDDKQELEPYVFVRDIDTLYAETACGSGSLACTIVQSFLADKEIKSLDIKQPSGMTLTVSLELDKDFIRCGSVKGNVYIL